MPPVVRGCKEPLPVDLCEFIMKAPDIGRISGVVVIEEHDVRTDAHATLHVRIARRTSAAPLRLPAVCDLPEVGVGGIDDTCCHREFVWTGVNVTSCWMCHWHRRPEDHRTAVRAEPQDWRMSGTHEYRKK